MVKFNLYILIGLLFIMASCGNNDARNKSINTDKSSALKTEATKGKVEKNKGDKRMNSYTVLSRVNTEDAPAKLWIKYNEAAKNYSFKIEVAKSNCTGELFGTAKKAAFEEAIYVDDNCEELVFSFIYKAEIVEEVILVSEKKCHFHGLGCSFEGEYKARKEIP